MTISLAHPEDFGIRAELLDWSRPIEPRLYLYVERELAKSTDSRSFFCLGAYSIPPEIVLIPSDFANYEIRGRGTRCNERCASWMALELDAFICAHRISEISSSHSPTYVTSCNATAYYVTSFPAAAAVADFKGDHKLDLAVANFGAPTI